MASFFLTCPHCGSRHQAEEENIGVVTQCPDCAGELIIKPPPAPATPAAAPSADRRYVWGRLFIRLAWLLAVGLLCVGVYFCVVALMGYLNGSAALRARANKEIGKLQVQQREVAAQYDYMINQLREKRSADGSRTGIAIPNDLLGPTLTVGAKLDSVAAVTAALDDLKRIDVKVAAIKKIFVDTNTAWVDRVLRNLGSGASTQRATSGNDDNVTLSIASIDAVMVDFYEKEQNAQSQWEKALQKLNELKNSPAAAGDARLRDDLNGAGEQLKFIEENLFSVVSRFAIGGGSGNFDTGAAREAPVTAARRDDDRGQMVQRLKAYRDGVESLAHNWMIDKLVKDLREGLNRQLGEEISLAKDLKILRAAMLNAILEIALKSLAAAFLVMVFADYLRAHFDMAERRP